MVLNRLSPRKIAMLRRLCAAVPIEAIASEFGVTPGTILDARDVIMIRSPRGSTFRDVCLAAAEEDPTVVVSPDLGKRTSTIRRTSR